MSKCAPHIQAGGSSCFTLAQLQEIATACNNDATCSRLSNGGVINISQSKSKLWDNIKDKLSSKCTYEWCWVDQDFIYRIKDSQIRESILNTFRPPGPSTSRKWLNTTQINMVMSQYELKYPDFKFYGPFPIDFKEVYQVIYNLDLSTLYHNGIKRLGFVFNLDPSHKSGSHWVAMFVDMRRKKRVIGFYDSVGSCPPPKEIAVFINRLASQHGKIYRGSERGEFNIKCNTYQHQKSNSECGVYAMYFLLRSLRGHSFESIVRDMIVDDEMNGYRHLFFTPEK